MTTIPITAPPADWNMIVGDWATDATLQENTLGVVTSTKSIRLEATATATQVESEVFPIVTHQASLATNRYIIGIPFTSSASGAGNEITLAVDLYNAAGTLISSSYLIDGVSGTTFDGSASAFPASTNLTFTYVILTTGGVPAYGRIRLAKNTTAFSVDIWGIILRQNPAFVAQYNTAPTTGIPDNAATWTALTIPLIDELRCFSQSAGATTQLRYPIIPGYYHFTGVAKTDDLGSMDCFQVRIRIGSSYFYGSIATGNGAVTDWYSVAVCNKFMAAGATVELQARYWTAAGGGGNIDVTAERFEAIDSQPWE